MSLKLFVSRSRALGGRRAIAAALAAAALAACRDDPTGPDRTPAGVRSSSAVGEELAIVEDRGVVQRVDLDVSATGSFRPGQPITVRATARANRPADDAAVTLSVVGVDTLPAASGRPGGMAPPRRLAARSGGLPAGAQAPVEGSVVFDAPGYYQIVAHVATRPSTDDTPERRRAAGLPWVNDTTVRVLNVLIDERGGRVTRGWEPGAASDSTRSARFGGLGAFRAAGGAHPAHGGPGSGAKAPAPTSGSAGSSTTMSTYPRYFRGYVWYRDLEFSPAPSQGLRNAGVHVDCLDAYGRPNETLQRRTDQTGYYEFTCQYGAAGGIYVSAHLSNNHVDVRNGNGTPPSVGTQQGPGASYVPDLYFGNNHAARTYDRLDEYAPALVQGFGRSRPQIRVNAYDYAGGLTRYYPGATQTSVDSIVMNSDAVFYQYGTFAIVHEYAHSLHFRGIEPWRNPTQTRGCASPHYVHLESTLRCAFVEGFADAATAWVAGNRLYSDFAYSDDVFEGNTHRATGNGAIIEAAVAGFFYDILDGPGQPDANPSVDDERAAWGGGYVSAVIATCAPKTSATATALTAIDGVDEFIYCAGHTPGDWQFNTYTQGTWRRHTSAAESATEPGGATHDATVRGLWQYNLYNAGSLPQ